MSKEEIFPLGKKFPRKMEILIEKGKDMVIATTDINRVPMEKERLPSPPPTSRTCCFAQGPPSSSSVQTPSLSSLLLP